MNIAVFSLSSSVDSVSRTCGQYLISRFEDADHKVNRVDVRDLPPVWVDDRELSSKPLEYREVGFVLANSDAVVLLCPVYCFTASSAAKLVTELFCKELTKMPVGILAAAGSMRSHLALGDLMLSMMFEQGTVCYPKTVLATRSEIEDGHPSDALKSRIDAFASDFTHFSAAIRQYRVPAADSSRLPRALLRVQP